MFKNERDRSSDGISAAVSGQWAFLSGEWRELIGDYENISDQFHVYYLEEVYQGYAIRRHVLNVNDKVISTEEMMIKRPEYLV